jgi:iron complex outermembrane receptor protein
VNRAALPVSFVFAAMLLAQWSIAPAAAAEQPRTVQSQTEEIIVTARRKEEALQDVPAAVTVINNEQMFISGNDSMDQLRDVVPNFQFASDMAYRSRTAVRGIGSDRSGAQTNGVGFFIDGVYQAGTSRFNAPFFDVERVEVLKGPQGARYGRNAFAGVVNVITRKPDDEFRANVQTTAENQGGLEAAGMISGPIIEGRLYGKLSAAHNESEGDYQHSITGEDMVPLESDFYSARLVWEATDRLEFDLEYAKSDNDGIAFAFSQTDSLQDLSENFVVRDDQSSGQDNDEASLVATWTGESVVVRNLLAYRDSYTHLRVDGDVTQFEGFLALVQTDSETWTDELRIQSNTNAPMSWLVGGEVYHSEADAAFPTFILNQVGEALGDPFWNILAGIVSANTIEGESDVWSVFGEVSYEFFDRLEVVASARYDDIESTVFNQAGGITASGLGDKFTDEKLQPLFSVRYSLDDYSSVYVSAAKGIREGGFNASALTFDYGTFETDELWSYEIGLKKTFPESGAFFNVSAFYMDADNLNQAAIIRTDAGTLANGAITLGGADSYGVEFDMSMPVIETVDWTFAMGVLDCTLKDVTPYEERSPDSRQVAAGVKNGNECQDSAEWSFNTNLNGEWALGNGGWAAIATLGLSGKGEIRLTTDNGFPTNGLPLFGSIDASDRVFRREEEIQEPVYLLDATIGVRNEHWTILAYGENLTDQLYALDHYHHEGLCDSGICGLGEGQFITTLAPQRRVGLKVRYDM